MRKVRVIAELIRCLPQDGSSLLSQSSPCVCMSEEGIVDRYVCMCHPGVLWSHFPGVRTWAHKWPQWIYSSNCVYFYNTHNLSPIPSQQPQTTRTLAAIAQILDGDKCAPLRNDCPNSLAWNDDGHGVGGWMDEWRCLVIFRFYCGTI